MKKEDLLKLKEKIENLTEEERKLRYQYLKDLATGKIQGPPVGYPTIDMPQLKTYRDEPIKDISQCKTVYDMVFEGNNPDSEAIGFLDGRCTWTYRKLKEITDKSIDALANEGVKEGDTVLLGVTNTPELIATIIALVSLGATVKLFDIRANAKSIAEYANFENCKYMIALDQIVLPKIDSVIDETGLEKVFVLQPGNSLSTTEKIKYLYENRANLIETIKTSKIKLPNDGKHYSLTKVIKKGRISDANRVEYDENRPSFKVQSSGTTGKAKTIVHSERSAVEFAKSIAYTDLPLGKGKKVLVALPPWIAYGLGDAILMSLALGSKVMLCADFEPNAVYRNIGSFTLSYAAPFHYRYIREHYDELSDEKKAQLAKVDCMITGGDKYSALENSEDETRFGTVIVNGYGNNEDWGALSVNPAHANRYGSVGVPKYGEVAMIYDNEKGVELPYGEVGEVCTLSNTRFMRYEGNEAATNKTLRVHDDGKTWIHTGDQGYIDSDGYIFLKGRQERVITRLGFKISAYTIEDAITSLPYVSECITVEVPDENEEHVPMSFVVLDKNCNLDREQAEMLIKRDCEKKLKENEIPKHVKVVEKLKYTDNNKYDFRYYEQLGHDYVEILPKKARH